MKIFTFIFLLWTGNAFCQPFDITLFLDSWIGSWQTTYEVEGGMHPGTAKEEITISGAAKNVYLHIHIHGWMKGDSAVYSWVEDEFLTYSPSAKQIEGFYISSNGADLSETLKGDWEEGSNRIIREGESKFTLPITKVTWELKDGKLHRTIEWTEKKDNKTNKVEHIYEKIK